MKNLLVDLQNHLFEMIEKLNDDSLEGDKLDQEIRRSMALNEVAKTAVANGALMVKCVDTLYGIPVSDKVPLIPKYEGDTYIVNKEKDSLMSLMKKRNDETAGYKKGRQNPI